MASTKPIPIRMTPALLARLDAIAKTLGTDRAKIINLCAMAFCEDFEKKGKAILPPDFEELFRTMDHRRTNFRCEPNKTVNQSNSIPESDLTAAANAGVAKIENAGQLPSPSREVDVTIAKTHRTNSDTSGHCNSSRLAPTRALNGRDK